MRDKFPPYDEKLDKKVRKSVRKWTCFDCGRQVKHFRDWVSKEEFFISGRCQVCQDDVFSWEESQHGVM